MAQDEITYKSVADASDRKFHCVAKRVLRDEYNYYAELARKAFHEAYRSAQPNKKVNDARRAANLVILAAMREYGITNWRDENQKPVKREVVKSDFASDKVKNRKFNSSCGLWEAKV